MMDSSQYIGGVHWYVIHTYSGYENKVKSSLEKIVVNRGLQNLIFEVNVPTVKEIVGEGDEAKEVETKLYPSYVMVRMIMNDFTWYIVRNITGVTGFVGPGSHPTPLTEEEVAKLGVQSAPIKTSGIGIGDNVTIKSGPFNGFSGAVEALSEDGKTVRVLASIFGRSTPVEVEVENVELTKF